MSVYTSRFANIRSQIKHIIFNHLYRDPQLQVGENLNYLFSALTHGC